MRLRQGVRQDLALSVGAVLVGQILLVLSGLLVPRMLGVEGRGYLALFMVLAVIASQIGTLGLPLASTFWIASGRNSDRQVMRGILRPAIVQACVLTAVQCGAVIALVGTDNSDAGGAALLSLVFLPATVAYLYGMAVLQGQQEFRLFNICRIIPPAVYATGVAVAYAVGSESLLAITGLWALAMASAGAAAVYFAFRGRASEVSEHVALDRRGMLRFGLRGWLGSVSPTDTFMLDQAVVALFLSTQDLGIYVVALAFANLPRFLGVSIGYVSYPFTAAQTTPADRVRATKRLVTLTAITSGVVVLVLEIAAPSLVPFLFGDDFSGSTEVAQILLIGSWLVSVRRVLSESVRGWDRPGLTSLAELVAWFVLVPAVFVLAPLEGTIGVALAMAIAAGASLVVLLAATVWSRDPPVVERPAAGASP